MGLEKEVILRPLKEEDLERIDTIYRHYHARDFSIPTLDQSITSVATDSSDRVVGFGMIRLIPEVIMVLDLGETRRKKILVLEKLIRQAVEEIRKTPYNGLHAFVQNDNFST